MLSGRDVTARTIGLPSAAHIVDVRLGSRHEDRSDQDPLAGVLSNCDAAVFDSVDVKAKPSGRPAAGLDNDAFAYRCQGACCQVCPSGSRRQTTGGSNCGAHSSSRLNDGDLCEDADT